MNTEPHLSSCNAPWFSTVNNSFLYTFRIPNAVTIRNTYHIIPQLRNLTTHLRAFAASREPICLSRRREEKPTMRTGASKTRSKLKVTLAQYTISDFSALSPASYALLLCAVLTALRVESVRITLAQLFYVLRGYIVHRNIESRRKRRNVPKAVT